MLPPEIAASLANSILLEKYPQAIAKLGDTIEFHAVNNGLDPNLVGAVIYVESWFDPAATSGYARCPAGPVTSSCTSDAGAIGEMQVMAFNAAGHDLRETEQNIKRGCELLRECIDATGSVYDGLRAYYAGVTGALHYGLGFEYANRVQDILQKITQKDLQ